MTLIEGFGDEVTILLMTTLVVVVVYLVWLSTYVPDRPLLYLQLSSTNAANQQPLDNSDIEGITGFESPIGGGSGTRGNQSNINQSGVEHLSSPFNNNDAITEISQNQNEDGGVGDANQMETAADEDSAENDEPIISPTATVSTSTMSSVRAFFGRRLPQSLPTLRRRNVNRNVNGDNLNNGNVAVNGGNNTVTETTGTQSPSMSNTTNTEAATNGQFSLSCLCLELPEELKEQRSSCYFIKLKFLSDLQVQVEVAPCEKLHHFKYRVFKKLMDEGSVVRLIFAGGLLRDESVALADCGILSHSVVHCQILSSNGGRLNTSTASSSSTLNNSAAASSSTNSNYFPSQTDSFNTENIDLSNLLFLLFAVFLLILWYLRFSYRHLFTPPTTFTLIAITLLFLFAVYASFIL